MKLLLDENLPKALKKDFPEHEMFTVSDKKWNGIGNGKLMKLMQDDGFDGMLTFDRNIPHQQNPEKWGLKIYVIEAPENSYKILKNWVEKIRQFLIENPESGSHFIF